MGYKQIKALVKKEILRLIKEPALLFLIVIFPIALTLSFGVAFGQVGDGGESTYSIGWVNYDDNQTHWATSFRSNLSSNEMLRLEDYNSLDDALDKLQAGELSGVVVVPDNFGDSIESYWNSPQDTGSWINSSVELYVDESSLVMKQTLTPLIQQSYVDTLYGSEQTTIETPVDVELISAVETKETSMFDVFMPGLFAFGVIFLTMSIAQGITGEKKEGLLKRIWLTPTKSTDVMTSYAISNVLIAVFQMSLILALGLALGFQAILTPASVVMSYVMILPLAVLCIGLGLIVGVVSKNDGMATGLSFVFIIPMMFLGTFVSMGEPTAVNKAMPSYYATESIKSLLFRGIDPLSATILTNFGILTAMAAVVFVIGSLVFARFSRK